MKKQRRNLTILSLLFLFVMALTWYSCTKQEEVVRNDSKITIETFKKAVFEVEKKYKNNSLESIDDSIVSCFNTDTPDDCNGEFIFLRTDTAIVNVYNNCKAEVIYDLYRCLEITQVNPPEVLYSFYVDNFTAVPIETECDSVILLWNDLVENGKWDEFLESSETFLRDAQKATELYIVNDFFFVDPGLGVFFGCNDPNTTLSVNFYTANCYQTYMKVWIKGGVFHWKTDIERCGESCCKSSTFYCVKQDGSIFVSDPVIEQVGDCESINPEYPKERGFFPIGDCNHVVVIDN